MRNYILFSLLSASVLFSGTANLKNNEVIDQSNALKLSINASDDVLGVQFDVFYDPTQVSINESDIVSKVEDVELYAKVSNKDGKARVLMFSLNGTKILDSKSTDISDFVEMSFTAVDGYLGNSIIKVEDITLAGEHGQEIETISSATNKKKNF